MCSFMIMCRYLNRTYIIEIIENLLFCPVIILWHVTVKVCYVTVHQCHRVLLCKAIYINVCLSCTGLADSALWIKIRGISVVSADSTNVSGLAWKKKVGTPPSCHHAQEKKYRALNSYFMTINVVFLLPFWNSTKSCRDTCRDAK